MKTRTRYVPAAGELVWLTFDPTAGHEQAGRRPALVLSPIEYNRLTGLALMCPITSRVKGYSFEVPLPPGLPVSGVVLADQVKNLDWRQRQVVRIALAPPSLHASVYQRLDKLLEPGN